jgi:copper chaperone CopZ
MGPAIRLRILSGHTLIIAVVLIPAGDVVMAATERGSLQVQIVADDMCCQGCAQKIAGQLYAAPGVTSVEADIPNRIVKVTANRTAKLTLERLWRAVEKGKGGPSKLITADATYTLTRPGELEPERRLASGRYVIEAPQLGVPADAQSIAKRLYSVRGVQHVSIDAAKSTLLIQSSANEQLSMWILAAIMQQTGSVPATIAGPHGLLNIKRAASQLGRSAAVPSQVNTQGGVR